ncbi:hypothetical protein CFC21_096746 [Triticum aestivum]|uniref:Uncharacterized protein n=2 Tax=Triticum aestivum TaxID=4565 RepID=A0A9R1MYT5_WHEAT|nr:hypothetical protein CFC21_096746 [Triticum aestivum]
MARPNLMMEKAEELAHFGIPVEPDVWMSGRWRLRLSRVLVAPVSTVSTHGFVCAIVIRIGDEHLSKSGLNTKLKINLLETPNK